MAKKKSNAKDVRGYATTSIAPLTVPQSVVAASVTPPPLSPTHSEDTSGPSTTTTTHKKKKKEAAQAAEVSKFSNIKPIPLPPGPDSSAAWLKLPTPEAEKTYAEAEDIILQVLEFAWQEPGNGEYSRFDLETVYETLLQRDGFQRQDLEQAMLVCRGHLPACHDWLSLNVPRERLPEGWCFVPSVAGSGKTAAAASKQLAVAEQQQQVGTTRRTPSDIVALDQGSSHEETTVDDVKRSPIRLVKSPSTSSSTCLDGEAGEEDGEEERTFAEEEERYLESEFTEEFDHLQGGGLDYMQEDEEPVPIATPPPPPQANDAGDEDEEVQAELALMQNLEWKDAVDTTPPKPSPRKPSMVEEESYSLGMFEEEEVSSTATRNVTVGAPRFEGRIPSNYRGTTPKGLLLAYCKREDMPNPVFSLSNRLLGRVTVRTKLGKTLTFEADHVCANESLAQELVSVKALFELRALANDTSYQNSFPPDFRAVWKQLVEDEANRAQALLLEASKQRRDFVTLLLATPARRSCSSTSKQQAGRLAASKSQQRRTTSANAPLLVSAERDILPLFEFKSGNQAHLPINSLREEILQAHFSSAQVVIISAETGSGKSTQVPQFLLEAYAERGEVPKMCITQPRRISAVSVANRVAEELGDDKHQFVGYTIRGKSTRRHTTSLLFCTSGVLLQHFSTSGGAEDAAFSSEFDIVILDEVHERTVEGDVLMVCLKRMLALNAKLKVVLMSATMDSARLSEYFGHCPVLHSSGGRVFPVETLYLEDLIERTGFRPESTGGEKDLTKDLPDLDPAHYSDETCKAIQMLDEQVVNAELIQSALELMVSMASGGGREDDEQREETWLVFLPGLRDLIKVESQLLSHRAFGDARRFQILLLHSTLVRDFSQFFERDAHMAPKRIVLCTNIAETGITLPHVSGVIDTGRVNELRFNEKKNLTILREAFCSKASCEQRKGRAGRVKSGICIRLVTRQTYHAAFPAQAKPEIQRVSLSEICLKLLNHASFAPIGDFFAEALDAPGEHSVVKALDRLAKLGCITNVQECRLTELGRVVSRLPMDAALGKIVVFGAVLRCAKRASLLAALVSFSSGSIFAHKKQVDNLLLEMQRFVEWERAPNKRSFVREHALDNNRLGEVLKLRNQYLAALQDEFPGQTLSDASASSNRILSSLLCAGLGLVYGGGGGRFNCHDNIEVRAKNLPPAQQQGASKFYTYLERMKVGQVFVSGLTALHPVAIVLFSHVPSKFTVSVSRVDLGNNNAWAQLRCIAPRTCALFSLLRTTFDRTVEQCLARKRFTDSSSAAIIDLVLDLVDHVE